jgi:hypothetical protein
MKKKIKRKIKKGKNNLADKTAKKQPKLKGKPRGKGKPFKPGQSGNPKGRPPGTLSLVTLLKKALQEEGNEQMKNAIEMSKQGWIEQGQKDERDRIAGIVKKIQPYTKPLGDLTGRDTKYFEFGYNQALQDLLNKLEKHGLYKRK